MNKITYNKFKKLLLDNFSDMRVLIQLRGTIDTKIFLDKANININQNKLVMSNDNKDVSIELMNIKKIIMNQKYRIELLYEEFTIILEL